MDSVMVLLLAILAGGIALAIMAHLDNRRRDRERRDHP